MREGAGGLWMGGLVLVLFPPFSLGFSTGWMGVSYGVLDWGRWFGGDLMGNGLG